MSGELRPELATVGIIIPSFNNFDYVKLAVESAARTPNACVIVIDDASPQWPGERIVSGYLPRGVSFVIQRFDANAGLSRSWNAGLRIAREMGLNYAVCGNSDLVFADGWWSPLAKALDRFDFVGPVTNAPGHITAQDVERYFARYQVSDDPDDIDSTQKSLNALSAEPFGRSVLNGFCFAGRTKRFWDVSSPPFSPDIPMAGNEDYFFELAKEKGLTAAIVPKSFVFHYRSVSRGSGRGQLDKGMMRLPEGCGGCQQKMEERKMGGEETNQANVASGVDSGNVQSPPETKEDNAISGHDGVYRGVRNPTITTQLPGAVPLASSNVPAVDERKESEDVNSIQNNPPKELIPGLDYGIDPTRDRPDNSTRKVSTSF